MNVFKLKYLVPLTSFIIGGVLGYKSKAGSIEVLVPAEVDIPLVEEEVILEEVMEEATLDDLTEEVIFDEGWEEEAWDTPIEVPEERLINIFTVDDDWNYELEYEKRGNGIYIIHADEYIQGDYEFKQETVTYYAEDDIMADMEDTPIYNYYDRMGELKFGHGSKDKNVVYIRNERLNREWEVLLHHGSYEVEVKGLYNDGGELKHSLRKFRDD
jgi:hypothetical protein